MVMFSNLVIGIISSLAATALIGSATYKFVKNKKNSGNIQKNGENQIVINKSKNNSIKIGGGSSEKK